MLTKKPKPAYKRFFTYTLGTVFVAETIGFVLSYGLYFKLNTDRGGFNNFLANILVKLLK